MRYSMAAASMAHTYGNVTMFINQWLLKLFPNDYFKTNYINSTIAYRDFATFNNNRKQFIKKQKPMLLVRPRIEINTLDELPLNQTYFCNRIYDTMNEDIDTGNLQNFFWDKDNNRQIQFLMNCLRINFDVSLVVETMMEQINLVHYFKNRVRQNYDIDLIGNLESFVSRDIMYVLAKDAGFEDVFTEEGSHRMGEFYHIPHGLANAVILPVMLQEYGSKAHKKLAHLAYEAKIASKEDNVEVAANKFISWVYEMNEKMNIPTGFEQIQEEDIEEMSTKADNEGNPLYPVPVLYNKEQLGKIYRKLILSNN